MRIINYKRRIEKYSNKSIYKSTKTFIIFKREASRAFFLKSHIMNVTRYPRVIKIKHA